jgi:hypothetical protein
MQPITLVYTYYENRDLLRRHVRAWESYPPGFRFVVVDDGSPRQPAHEQLPDTRVPLEIYRVLVNIPWNSHGARNLAARVCTTEWMLMADMDTLLAPRGAHALARVELDERCVYRFRIHSEWGRIAGPKKNLFLCTRTAFWDVGGYDEDYAGTYGGDGIVEEGLRRRCRRTILEDVVLEHYPKRLFRQASTTDWDRAEFRLRYLAVRAAKRARGDTVARDPVRFPWERVR